MTANDIEDHWPSLAFSTLQAAKEYLRRHPSERYRYIQPIEMDTEIESEYKDAIFED
jgi:hypothetical protein